MSQVSKIEILGGGPGGLYTAILIRRLLPHVNVRVTEQNAQGATFGFGVVFSDGALSFLKADDPETHDLIVPQMERWKNMTLNLPKGQEVLDGVGFTSIGRLELIEILRERAQELGVEIRFDTHVDDIDSLEADLVIGADGLNSLVRQTLGEKFKPHMDHFSNHFAWFGAKVPFDTLTQSFIETEHGPMNAHHYRYTPELSTFIVECDPATHKAFGFAEMDEEASAKLCATLFKDVLKGTDLVTNKSMWRQFPRLWCDQWVSGRYALLGDAVHTAHFSIGSGTRLAMEDALALVHSLVDHDTLEEALAHYQDTRVPIARKIVDAANTSAHWYDSFGDKMPLDPTEFAFDYLKRSGRVNRARLRQMSPEFMARFEAREAELAKPIVDPVPDNLPGAAEIGFNRSQHENCSDILWQNLDRNPDKAAIVGPSGTLSYRQLIAEAGQWGNAFSAAGLKRGERIAFFLDDTPTFPAAFFGAVRTGFVPVLLNTQTKPDVLNYFLKDSGARFAVIDADLQGVFDRDTLAGTELQSIIVANGDVSLSLGLSTAQFLQGHSSDLACADTQPDDMAFWMYSSGSTGRPKGIVHLHHDMAYANASFGDHVLKLTADDISYSVPKMYFAYGFGNSVIFPFSVGSTVLLMPGQPRPNTVLDAIETYRPTTFFGLPTLYTALMHSEDIADRDLSSLRQSMSAAEILSEDIYSAWKDKVGHGPTEGLGSTEMLHVYLSNYLDDHRLGAAGARVPGYEIQLLTPEGKPAASGEEGVMLVRGHSSAPCYWNRADKTQDTMRDDWIYTGDRFVERDGYYYFQGRADDLIKVSGQWVWPLEVERCLNGHPDIQECAVLAHQLADKRMALRAVATLMPRLEGDDAQINKLRDYVKSKLTPYKSPRVFEFVDTLPKTGTGKIDRQALVQDAASAA